MVRDTAEGQSSGKVKSLSPLSANLLTFCTEQGCRAAGAGGRICGAGGHIGIINVAIGTGGSLAPEFR